MRRRAPDETIEAFRRRVHAPQGEALCRRLAGSAATILDEATEARPDMPAGVEDRNADMWEPLLAVADIAGGEWPARARDAAKALLTVAREVEPSLNIRLLADLQTVFRQQKAEELTTKTILAALHVLEGAPWNDLKGKPLSDNQLGRRVANYGVKPKNVRFGDKVLKGYTRADFEDVWRRYLPPLIADKPATAATAATAQSFQDNFVADAKNEAATDGHKPLHDLPDVAARAGDVEACSGSADVGNADKTSVVAPVAAVAGFPGNGGGELDIPPALVRHRCDHCGGQIGMTNHWDWPGRPDGIWLHERCEAPWFDSEGRQ
jgi:hypothetical protein